MILTTFEYRDKLAESKFRNYLLLFTIYLLFINIFLLYLRHNLNFKLL